MKQRLIDASQIENKFLHWLNEISDDITNDIYQGSESDGIVACLEEIREAPTIDPESLRPSMISVKQALPPSSKVVMAYDFRGVLYLECCYFESANGWYDVRRHKPIHYEITYWMNYPDYPEIQE